MKDNFAPKAKHTSKDVAQAPIHLRHEAIIDPAKIQLADGYVMLSLVKTTETTKTGLYLPEGHVSRYWKVEIAGKGAEHLLGKVAIALNAGRSQIFEIRSKEFWLTTMPNIAAWVDEDNISVELQPTKAFL